MAKPLVREYPSTSERAIKSLAAVVARLGYTVKAIDRENGLVTFETGMSWFSWAGQCMSAHVLDLKDSVQVTIGGTRKAHGAQIQVYDFGEARTIASRVFDQLNTVLGPSKKVDGADTTAGLTAGGAVAVTIVVVVIILVALMIATL